MVKRIGKLSVNVITEKESLLKRGFISESDLYVTWCCFLEYSCRSQWAVSLL